MHKERQAPAVRAGEVWLFVDTPEKRHGFNLGPPEQVVEKLSQWLASYDDGERFS